MKAPYPLILSLIIGVTNMIPYFGPFIGAIPAILITLLIDPPLAIAVGIFVLILQQFDGNYLGPKILGNSVDLNPLWIILAVLIGGAFMGPVGMFGGRARFRDYQNLCSEYVNQENILKNIRQMTPCPSKRFAGKTRKNQMRLYHKKWNLKSEAA